MQAHKRRLNIDYEAKGLIFDIDRFAVHDGPGIRMAIFLKGCEWICSWCHSPESQSQKQEIAYYETKCIGCLTCINLCPEGAISFYPDKKMVINSERCNICGECVEGCYSEALKLMGEWMTVEELFKIALKDKIFYECSGGGVTLTGGEVALQAEFSAHFLWACKDHSIHTAIETSGYSRWNRLKKIIIPVDLIIYDLKAMDPKIHVEKIGVSNRLILENLKKIRQLYSKKEIQIRVPCIPGMSDTEENIRETSQFVSSLGITQLALLPYNETASAKYQWMGRAYPFPDWKTQSPAHMKRLETIAASYGLEVEVQT
jgi:pyruvate formate lyase activating enzyme